MGAGGPRSDGAVLDGRKVAAARVFAATRYPYLASALFAADVCAVADSRTVAIDRTWRIHADPNVLKAMAADDVGRLLVHLVSHVLREHAGRADRAGVGGAEGSPDAWNQASDAEVNDDLVVDGMVPPSAPGLPADIGAEAGRLAEHYYDPTRPGGRRWDCGSGCDGIERPWEGDAGASGGGLGERDQAFVRLGVAAELQRAEGLAPGSIAAGWLRWAQELLPSRTDWRRILAAEVQAGVVRATGMVDYSYRRPSRRSESTPSVILPTLDRPVPDVAIVCDTSGSMSGDLLARVLSEVEAILQRVGLRGTQVRVLTCDAQVHSVKRVSRASQITLLGGGGTDMGEGIVQALALKPRPSIVVVLTDGFTPWPSEPPRGAKVVVGLLQSGRGPMGWMGAFAPPPWAKVVSITEDSAV